MFEREKFIFVLDCVGGGGVCGIQMRENVLDSLILCKILSTATLHSCSFLQAWYRIVLHMMVSVLSFNYSRGILALLDFSLLAIKGMGYENRMISPHEVLAACFLISVAITSFGFLPEY